MKTIAVTKIRTDGGTQPRAEMDMFAVDEYAESVRGGAEFPPVVVFYDGTDHWLADGFHRHAAHVAAGAEKIRADVRQGTRRDAILFSVGANATHGKRRTNADKRRAVETLLRDGDWARRSDRWIAEKCAVGHAFVSKLRGELPTVHRGQLPKREGLDGRARTLPERKPAEPTAQLTPEVRGALRDTPTSERRSELAVLAKQPAEAQPAIAEKIATGEARTVTEAVRLVRREELAARSVESLPDAKYRVLYADPPWQYGDSRGGLDGYSATAAEDHYPTVSTPELCVFADPSGRRVADLADENAVLFCWATFPLLIDALEVVRAWGFKYKTAFVWAKGRANFGHYHTASAELLLVCTRGSCTPDVDKREDQVQAIARTERHSAKPEDFRALIDRLYPHGRRIELFRRGTAPMGWEVWGNEATKERAA